jgi:NAD(P)-dependent dehydrogenase (short-subunit alcohol dehydrogenase family)
MEISDFQLVMDVHVMGSVNCTKAVWDIICEQNYGRIVMTTSSSGMYGNFGQYNYGAAKMALIGLMNTLVLEGAKYDIRINALARKEAPNRMILAAGGGGYSQVQMIETEGIYLTPDKQTPETILSQWDELVNPEGQKTFEAGPKQIEKVLQKSLKS